MAEHIELPLCEGEPSAKSRGTIQEDNDSISSVTCTGENQSLLRNRYIEGDGDGDIDVLIEGNFDDLPTGKKYHIFIAHSALDGDQALQICKELENRFLLKCMYFDRDFTPAKRIDENIQHEMEKSVKVLLILSPDFLDSHWCDMEARLAVQMSFDRAFSLRIIPLILRDIDADKDLPPFLKPYVCIDARKEYDSVAKIHEAFYHSGVVDAAHQAELESKFAEDNRNQNGAHLLELEGKMMKSACFNASHFEFPDLTERDYSCMGSIEAQNQLERSIDVVNSSCLMRNYRIFKNGMFQYGISLLMSLLVAFLYITVGLSETFGSRDVNDMWNTHVNPGIFLLFISFPLIIFILRKFRNKEYTSLLLTKKSLVKQEVFDDIQARAKAMILKKLLEWNERGRLVNWQSMESGAYNRHNTWLRKSCVCQVLEKDIITRDVASRK